jgi:hypothetical protein
MRKLLIPIRTKKLLLILGVALFFGGAIIPELGQARATGPNTNGLSCIATLTLPNGTTQTGVANIADSSILGPVVTANFSEGGQTTDVPYLTSSIAGAISAVPGQRDMLAITFEAIISKVEFKPFVEDRMVARGAMVLSRKIRHLSKGSFQVAGARSAARDTTQGSIAIECELRAHALSPGRI